MRLVLIAVAVSLLPWTHSQDPVRAAPQDPVRSKPTSRPTSSSPTSQPTSEPTVRPPLAPIDEPFVARVDRSDLLQRFGKPSGLEGFWSLRSMVREGRTLANARGYVVFGSRIMTINTMIFLNAGDSPFVQSSVRDYRVAGDKLTTTTRIGHEYGERLALEQSGRIEVRSFRRSGTALRIHRDVRNYMEFVRVE